jgi:hypothetical protein
LSVRKRFNEIRKMVPNLMIVTYYATSSKPHY